MASPFNNPFDSSKNDDGDDLKFDPTCPSFLRSQCGEEVPPVEQFQFISGATHPRLRHIRRLTGPLERGGIALPSAILLLNDDGQDCLSRTPIYAQDLVFNSEDRCKHIMAIGPTGSGKNAQVLNLLRFSAILDPSQTVVSASLKSSDFGPIQKSCEQAGKRLVVINLTDRNRSVCWNPLERADPDQAYEIIRRFAFAAEQSFTTHWRDMMILAMHGAYQAGYTSFPAMYDLLGMREAELIEEFKRHGNPQSNQFAAYMAGGSHNAQTAQATLNGSFSNFISENVRAVMAMDELNLRELFREPVCLHIELPETTLEVHVVLYEMLVKCVVDQLIANADEAGIESIPTTLFLDDLPSLGPVLPPNRLMTMRSRNIGVVSGVQSIASLQLAYREETLAVLENFGTKIVLPGGAIDDAAYFAKSSGEQLVAIPLGEDRNPVLLQRPMLSASQIRNPNYEHPILGLPATIFCGAKTFQAYLQRSYEHPSFSAIVRATRHVTGLEPLRKADESSLEEQLVRCSNCRSQDRLGTAKCKNCNQSLPILILSASFDGYEIEIRRVSNKVAVAKIVASATGLSVQEALQLIERVDRSPVSVGKTSIRQVAERFLAELQQSGGLGLLRKVKK